MEVSKMFSILDSILEDAKVAVLATVSEDGYPHLRWMTPVLIQGRTGYIYAVTSPKFPKAVDLEENDKVEWIFQTKAVDKIMNVRGKIQVLDNPEVKSEVLEAIGGNLGVFWRVNPDAGDLVVLETIVEEMHYFQPISGHRDSAKLS